MFGALIVIIGVFFLLKNLGLVADNAWSILWPLLIIMIGLKLLLVKRNRRWHDWRCFGERMHEKFHERRDQDKK
ncbi:MAG: DUF5668 domain-containing protein [Candidatus Pacebacteria bacterium]|nr:DUF5668 domain-containing protein [Candidatus Paceibacterota bacterium]